MRTEDVRGSASRPQETADWFGGSVASSRIDGIGTVYADLVLSVPSLELEAALDDLREVTTDKVGGEDVAEDSWTYGPASGTFSPPRRACSGCTPRPRASTILSTVAGTTISVLVFGWWLVPALVAAAVW